MDVEVGNSTFYSIIRSNNVDSLRDRLKETELEPAGLYQLLGAAYEELRLKNVPISRKMQFEVEWKIAELQFFADNHTRQADDFKTFKCAKQHLELTCELIDSFLSKYFNRQTPTNLSFISDAGLVASHISVLKRRLDFTYNKVPWEEMEFCMVLLVLTITKPKETELTYDLVLDKERVLNQLNNFLGQLSELRDWFIQEESAESDSSQLKAMKTKLEAIKVKGQLKGRIGCKQVILEKSPQFSELYQDFSLLRDVYTLNRIKHYLEIALSVDLDADPTIACLVIQRALQVIGEYLKNERDSPNFSEDLYQVFVKLVATNLQSTTHNLRNMLSHLHTLDKRLELETREDKNIFKNIQSDLKTVNAEIVRLLYKRKIDGVKVFLEKLLDCTAIEQIQQIFQYVDVNKLDEFKTIEPPNLFHIKSLVSAFWNEVKDDIDGDNHIDSVIENLNSYEARLKDIAATYLKSIKALHQISKSKQLKKTQNLASSYLGLLTSSDLKGIFEEGIFGSLHLIYKIFKRTRCEDVNDTSSTDQKLIDVTKILTKIHDILKWDLQRTQWLEKINIELENQPIDTHHIKENIRKLLIKVKEQLNTLKPTEGNLFWASVLKEEEKHEAKAKLLNSMKHPDFDTILSSMNLDSKVRTMISTSYKKKNYKELEERIKGRIADPYGLLLKNLEMMEDIFPLETYFKHLKKFYSGIGLNKTVLDKVVDVTRDITLQDIQINYCKRLSTLNDVCTSVVDFKSKNHNPSFEAALEMLVLDLTEYIEKMGRLDDNKTFLIEKLSILNGKQLRNHLAHGNVMTHILPYSTYVPLLLYSEGLLNLTDAVITQRGTWTIGFKFPTDDMSSYITKRQSIAKLQDNLFGCAEDGCLDDVLLLINAGADVYGKDANGRSLLDLAIKHNNQPLTVFLITNVIKERNITQFVSPQAVLSSFETFSYFLQNTNFDINFVYENDTTLLHFAAELGQIKIAEFLLENMKEPFKANIFDETLLHLASRNGFLDAVLLLLEHNGDFLDRQSHTGDTALHMSAENGHSGVVDYLIKKNADVSLKRRDSFTAFELAVRNDHRDIVNKFLEIDEIATSLEQITEAFLLASQYGRSAILHTFLKYPEIAVKVNEAAYMATVFGHADVLKILISNGAEVNYKHVNDNTLLHIASQYDHLEIMNILLHNNTRVNGRNRAMWTPLHFAFQNNNSTIINLLISKGADVDLFDINGLTPVHVAAENGNIAAVELILKISPIYLDKLAENTKWTALHLAAGQGQTGVVKLLISRKADVSSQAADKSTPLHWAIQRHGYVDIVTLLLEAEAQVNLQDRYGATPLHTAVLNQNKEIVDILLRHGADVSITNKTKYTPLHVAAMYDNYEVVELLLTKMDDVSIGDHVLQTPLHTAATHGCTEIVELLLEKGADCNLVDINLVTALHLAAYHGHIKIVKLLVERGAAVTEHDNINRTPLFMAIIKKHEDIAMFLIENGANVTERIKEGVSILSSSIKNNLVNVASAAIRTGININESHTLSRITPLIIALLECNESIALLLLEQKEIDVNASTATGWTALHVASGKGVMSCVKKILTFNTNVNAKTEKGETPLYFAAEKGHNDIVKKLLEHGAAPDELVQSAYPTALCSAVRNGHREVVETLIRTQRVYANIKLKRETTPLHVAILAGYTEITKIILECSETIIDVAAEGKYTALHFAAMNGNPDIMRLLLERDVSHIINAATADGNTALHLAALRRHKDIVQMLIENDADITLVNLNDLTAEDIAVQNEFAEIVGIFQNKYY